MYLEKGDIIQYNDKAETLYSALESTLTIVPDYKNIYTLLNNIYNRILNQNTSFSTIKLVGKFAKTDYLLKEKSASKELIHIINDFRIRTNNIGKYSIDELNNFYPYDLMALAKFISLIYDTAIPLNLSTNFPEDKNYKTYNNSTNSYIRVVVNNWDSNYIYCTDENSPDNEIKIYYGAGCGIYKYDFTYISSLLFKNAQLNIIKPTYNDDIIIPELIIFEPDYLVDISSVASCFESYAEDAILYLINKIKPNISTSAILLGNLAGQFLDEVVHSRDCEFNYNDSVKNFFRKNAISILSAKIEPDFHIKAREQKANILKSIGDELPQRVSTFNFDNTILEPSFFSEMLGLQGRMDLLQSDFSLLIEQKSGKCGYPQTDVETPVAQKKHYIQMLLYMAILRYNYPQQYKSNNNKLSAFLLYSKYKNSLLGLGFAPELLYNALKIRNEIVANEYNYANNGVDILDKLTPNIVNKKNINNNLWNNYILPQLSELLSPIKNATELEKAYYLRFIKFIEAEHIYSKIGNYKNEASGFASTWHNTLEEKLNAGTIYDKLLLVSPSKNHCGSVEEVILKFSCNTNQDIANFRVGDIVILYPYNCDTTPDIRKTIVHRCAITSIDNETIKLSLRATQTNAKLFLNESDKYWAVEHDFMESSYSSLYKNMHKFISAPKERRDLILLQRTPKISNSKKLNNDYGNFNDLALKVKQAEELFIIIGPPGTGKTSYGLLTTLKEELTEDNSNVLLLSYTNRAVDEICSKLVEENIDFIRIGNRNSCDEQYKSFLLENKSKECYNITDITDLITKTRVFVGTTTSINSNSAIFDLKQFSLAVIDEASQILEPNIVGILSEERNGMPSIKKVVMIGDHKQLPAVVQQSEFESKTDDKLLNGIFLKDCSLSLFERMLCKYKNDDSVTYMLTKQGRMHPDIAEFSNRQFYDNKLEIVPLPHQTEKLCVIDAVNSISDILSSYRVIFFASGKPQNNYSNKVNIIEAEIIADLVFKIYSSSKNDFDINKSVGVIVPYRNQISAIKKIIEERYHGLNLEKITIDTVERFQGSQRDCIIYGTTIQDIYQLKFLTENSFFENENVIDRRLNVAMTRAKKQLIFVGNPEVLSPNNLYSQLIEYSKQNKSYFEYKNIKKLFL
ncbi:MAG: AAA family ATPase [Bacteroidales bacterium]|nr:AAA family ATPase [Bacteroidales bacterium]